MGAVRAFRRQATQERGTNGTYGSSETYMFGAVLSVTFFGRLGARWGFVGDLVSRFNSGATSQKKCPLQPALPLKIKEHTAGNGSHD